MVADNTYDKIIAEYRASLDKVNQRIEELRNKPTEGRKLSIYYQMRADLRKTIREMSKHTNNKEE